MAMCLPRPIESTTTTAPNFSGSVMPPLFLSGTRFSILDLLHAAESKIKASEMNFINCFMVIMLCESFQDKYYLPNGLSWFDERLDLNIVSDCIFPDLPKILTRVY